MNKTTSPRWLAAVLCSALFSSGCNCGNQPPGGSGGGSGGGSAQDGGGGGAQDGGGGGIGQDGGGGGSSDGGSTDGGNITLVSIGLTPANPRVAIGTVLQLVATGVFSDGSNQDLGAQVTWTSSAPAIATVSTSGNAAGIAAGTAIISASVGTVSGTASLRVTAATLQSISITPNAPTIAKGTTQQFVATGTFSDSTTQDLTAQVQWASSSTAIATISTAGVATGVTLGSATITATRAGVSASTTLQVTNATLSSLALTPVSPAIAKGTAQQFAATGTFSDASTQDLTTLVSWSSSNLAVATLSSSAGSEGLASGVGVGTATITATRMGVSSSTSLTVTSAILNAIAITPNPASIPNGTSQQLTATGTFSDNTSQDLTAQVAWGSSNTATATISNAAGSEGLATALSPGTTTLSATLSGVSGSSSLTVTNANLQSLTVTPASASIATGSTQQYTAIGTYSDSTTRDLTAQVTWASSNTNVATISNAAGSAGLASGVGPGGTTITAALSGIAGTATLMVGGVTLQSIVVTPANATISVSATRQYTATGNYSDGSSKNITATVTWASTNTSVATISNAFVSKGLASAVAAGTTNITATLTGVTGSTGLTVSTASLSSIAVTPGSPGLPSGYKLQFKATGTYSDGSTQDITTNVTWASATAAVATISNAAGTKGVASGLMVGTSSISATLGATSGSTVLTVNSATLTSIAVAPASFTLARLATRQLAATGAFSNGAMLDVTTQVTWSSSKVFVAQVNTTGLVSAFATGTAVIMAAKGAVSGTSTVTVP